MSNQSGVKVVLFLVQAVSINSPMVYVYAAANVDT